MKNNLFFLIVLLFAGSLAGCITEYEPPISEQEMNGLLVVDGFVSNGEATFTISRSVSLSFTDDVSRLRVIGARVWVESEDGRRHEAYPGPIDGEYTTRIDRLNPDTRYRLRISLDGEEYESEYRAPQSTPPIGEIDFHLKEENGPLQVRVNTQGDAGQSPYYLWGYDEIWEIRAYQMATHYLGYPGNIYDYYSMGEANVLFGSYGKAIQEYPGRQSPYYYGWKYGGSQSFLLGSSKRLTENEIRDHVLYEVDVQDDRLSVLYYTKVRQYTLGEDAYHYFNNLKKNTEDAGSIFSPIPSEMQGNIVCSTDPDIPVIGYIEVSERTEKEIFKDRRELPYFRPYHWCNSWEVIHDMIGGVDPETGELLEIDEEWLTYLYARDLEEEYWTNNTCIDCRIQGGTKNRPWFWPNDHY